MLQPEMLIIWYSDEVIELGKGSLERLKKFESNSLYLAQALCTQKTVPEVRVIGDDEGDVNVLLDVIDPALSKLSISSHHERFCLPEYLADVNPYNLSKLFQQSTITPAYGFQCRLDSAGSLIPGPKCKRTLEDHLNLLSGNWSKTINPKASDRVDFIDNHAVFSLWQDF